MTDIISRHTIQFVTMVLALISAGLIGVLIVRRPWPVRMYLIGMYLWLFHVAIYCMVVLFFDIQIDLMAWSSVVRLHGVIMVFSTSAGIAHCQRRING